MKEVRPPDHVIFYDDNNKPILKWKLGYFGVQLPRIGEVVAVDYKHWLVRTIVHADCVHVFCGRG